MQVMIFSSCAWLRLNQQVCTINVCCSSRRKFSLSLCYVTMFGKAPQARSLTKPLDRLVHTHSHTQEMVSITDLLWLRPPPPPSIFQFPRSVISLFHPYFSQSSHLNLSSHFARLSLYFTFPFLLNASIIHTQFKRKEKHGAVVPTTSSCSWLVWVELSHYQLTNAGPVQYVLSGYFTLNTAGHSHTDIIVQKPRKLMNWCKNKKEMKEGERRTNI